MSAKKLQRNEEIIAKRKEGVSCIALGKIYNVSRERIYQVLREKIISNNLNGSQEKTQ